MSSGSLMSRYVALLGSINVGGNRLKMAELKAVLQEAEFDNVATIIASGNVLFDHPEAPDTSLEARIAEIVQESFGIDTIAAVRSKAELEAALAESPFAGGNEDGGEDKFVHVHFLKGQPSEAQFTKLMQDHEGRGNEKLAPGTRALHVDYCDGVAGSKLTGAFIEKRLACRGTARNIRSVKRIVETMDT